MRYEANTQYDYVGRLVSSLDTRQYRSAVEGFLFQCEDTSPVNSLAVFACRSFDGGHMAARGAGLHVHFVCVHTPRVFVPLNPIQSKAWAAMESEQRAGGRCSQAERGVCFAGGGVVCDADNSAMTAEWGRVRMRSQKASGERHQ